MGELFQPLPLRRVRKDDAPQGGAIQAAIPLQDVGAEVLSNGQQGRAPGFYHHPCGEVRVHHGNAQLRKAVGDRALAAADAAGDANDQIHSLAVIPK